MCKAPGGRPYLFDERELEWSNPTLTSPLSLARCQALKYLRLLLSSMDAGSWKQLKTKLTAEPIGSPTITSPERHILQRDWTDLRNTSSPFALDKAMRQRNIDP